MLKFVRVSLIAILIAVLISPDEGMADRSISRHKGPYHLTVSFDR
jgi:hypothetical protein